MEYFGSIKTKLPSYDYVAAWKNRFWIDDKKIKINYIINDWEEIRKIENRV